MGDRMDARQSAGSLSFVRRRPISRTVPGGDMRGMHQYRGRHGKRGPRLGRVAFVVSLALVISQDVGMIAAQAKEEDSAGPPTTTLKVQPTLVPGNPTCQTLTQSKNEFKIESDLGN